SGVFFFFSSRRRHTRFSRDWSSDVCSSDLTVHAIHEADAAHADRTPNELGRIPILEYHLIGPQRSQWTVTPEDLRTHLEMLYERGYRPVNLRDVVDRRLALPRGPSPVGLTFDAASPSPLRQGP